MFVVEYRSITQLASLFQNESFTNQRAKRISRYIDFKKISCVWTVRHVFWDILYRTGSSEPSRSSFRSLYKLRNLYSAAGVLHRPVSPQNFFHHTRAYVSVEWEKVKNRGKKTPNRRDSSHLNNPQPSFRVPKRNQCQGEIRVYYLRKSMFAR